ncbi:gliding motility-associated C-terminal domain-containing protein [Croceitalea rosinachiae]|uniref:Gliding motility-associated C-terminal domain-containing protein n=1 Tax=Croceitalea rosinachiae TaxID=3075596 RepID=A0ABU3A7X3_9FLAO|nr:gliding motility-associated C-terminal domain-containing protein [Croceitalea sp. F388]MDT0606277.1 gliding motility-associated C-terminal domain-containing protein [Croceitalea sp. F388]
MKTISFYGVFLTLVMCTLLAPNTQAQVLNKPTPADNPNLAGNSAWTAACASASFNEYYVNFTWNPPLVSGDNEFILELSDANGNFSSARELDRATDKNTEFDFDFSFALPEDVQGDNYRFRVRSTSPSVTSPSSDPFSMYFIGYNNPILVSQDGSGVIPPGGTLQVCDGSSIRIETHNVPDANTYQYSWYRSGTLLSETSNALTVSESGLYYVEIDYGIICSGSANTLSNTIEIVVATSQGVAIDPPSQTTLCATETVTLDANISGMGYLYTWFNGANIVSGPTVDDSSYVVDGSVTGFEGDYSVRIEGVGICAEQSNAITISSAADYTVSRGNDASLVLLPGQNQNLTVSTTALSPTYQWFRNGVAITGETSASITANQAGTYYAEVTQNGGACTLPPKNSEETTLVLPNNFEVIIDYVGTYSDCSSDNVTLTVLQINALDSGGNRSDVTSSLRTAFTYQWIKDGTNLPGLTSDQLTLNDVSDNGFYTVEGSITTFNTTSNPLGIRLTSDETLAISSTDLQLCDGVTVSISTTTDLTGESYTWTRDGVTVSTTDTELAAIETGTYQLSISSDGCPIQSNEIVITDFDASIVEIDGGNAIVFPEGESETVTATGASAFEWYDEGNNLLSNTDSVTLTDEGNYLLLASVGACQITRSFTVSYRDNFEIPNVITANGDGINDLWVIPNTYSRNTEVSVIIYNEKGEEIINENGYENNWPQSSVAFTKKNQIFYYKIKNARKTLRQGTITVIR